MEIPKGIPKGLKFPKGLGKCVPEKGLRRTLLLWGSALAPRGSIVTNAQFQRRRIPQDPKKNHWNAFQAAPKKRHFISENIFYC